MEQGGIKGGYNLLIERLDHAFDLNYISALAQSNPELNWVELEIESTDEISKKLFELTTNDQRLGFLLNLMGKVFNPINCNVFLIAYTYGFDPEKLSKQAAYIIKEREREAQDNMPIEEPNWTPFFTDNVVFSYWMECATTTSAVVLSVSEVCATYRELDFDSVMSGFIDDSLSRHFPWYKADGSWRDHLTNAETLPSILSSLSIGSSDLSNNNIKEYTQSFYGLLHYYLSQCNEGPAVNDTNMQELATGYGWSKPNSGISLKQEFTKFRDDPNERRSILNNKRSDKKRKTRLEDVLSYLIDRNTPRAHTLATDEYNMFMNAYNNCYV